MGIGNKPGMSSPMQKHHTLLANNLLWIEGELETLGNPHNYINQDGMLYLSINAPSIAPWGFTGMPLSRTPAIVTAVDHTQFLSFDRKEALEQFRKPGRTSRMILYLPIAIISGDAPMLGDARLGNFLEYIKGSFVGLENAAIHYLSDAPTELPMQSPLLYVNRKFILSYVQG